MIEMSFDFEHLVKSVKKKEPEPQQPLDNGARARISRRIRSIGTTFKQGVAEQITSLLLNNMDYFAQVIVSNDPYGSAKRRENVLRRALEHPKSRKYLVAAKKMRTYVNWDTNLFTEGVLEFLLENRIQYNQSEKEWLYWEVENFRLWLYDQQGVRL